MIRLFVALDIPLEVKDELASFCYGVPGARWIVAHQLHLTLHFIGEVDGAVCHDIRESLSNVKGSEVDLKLSGVGLFPPKKTPKVLWVGVENNENLGQLRNRIGAALRRGGVTLERRRFLPHITVARLRNCSRERLAHFVIDHNLDGLVKS